MKTYIAADIGGTQIRVAIYPESGTTPLRQKKIRTSGNDSPTDRLKNLIAELWLPGEEVQAIGACAPGFIDQDRGLVIRCANIADWVNLPLRKILQDRFHVPVFLGNDANMAALGEWRYGAGQGHNDLLYLTVSTGIGGGVISNGRLIVGSRGLGTELGHITVDHHGPPCGCGKRGHLEAFSSGTGIARYVAEQIAAGKETILKGQPSAKEISQAAREGDTLAQEALSRAGYYLGYSVADFLHMFNPSIIIFGGGVSQSGDLFFGSMRKAMAEAVISEEYIRDLVITNAALGDDAGLIGALALAQSGDPYAG